MCSSPARPLMVGLRPCRYFSVLLLCVSVGSSVHAGAGVRGGMAALAAAAAALTAATAEEGDRVADACLGASPLKPKVGPSASPERPDPNALCSILGHTH